LLKKVISTKRTIFWLFRLNSSSKEPFDGADPGEAQPYNPYSVITQEPVSEFEQINTSHQLNKTSFSSDVTSDQSGNCCPPQTNLSSTTLIESLSSLPDVQCIPFS
jgi:hypothetical protein